MGRSPDTDAHWRRGLTPSERADLDRDGVTIERELLQMRVEIPPPEASSVTTRPFVVGRDEAAWLGVNNRAFAWHPEQSNWGPDDLTARFREPWFEAGGFLLHQRDGRLAGFCWTKVHDDETPPLGEIYVIAVDPDFTGLGLGRALTLAGLHSLAERGLRIGMLYVEADNRPAVGLYESLGFRIHHHDVLVA